MKQKIYISTLFLLSIVSATFSQARLVLNSNPYIVLNGGSVGTPIHIVLANPATDAITWTGTAQANGGIISEGEHNKIQWNIATTSGTYSVPFTAAAAGPAIPVDVIIGTAGIGAGNIKFSTYRPTTTPNANLPYPSFVTNLNSNSSSLSGTGGADNSYRVVDRFWIVNANGYGVGTKPAGSMILNYVDAEYGGSNAVIEANLQAQRYSSANNDWDGYALTGSQSAGSYQGRVTGITFTITDFDAAWTLVDNRAPLPIELTEFKADCNEGQRNLHWTTASETNNQFFTIEKSADGATFTEIGIVNSKAMSGNSSTKLNYSYIDLNTVLGNYYRLKQTDYDGKFEYSAVIFNKCDDDASKPSSADIYPNPSNGLVNVLLTGYENQDIQINIMNAIGQQVESRKVLGGSTTQKETFSLVEQAKGIYYVTIITEKETITKKVINQY